MLLLQLVNDCDKLVVENDDLSKFDFYLVHGLDLD